VPIEDSDLAPYTLATVHPSSILREREAEARRAAEARFVDDLRAAAALI
jgi:DNA polymerase